MRRSEYEGLRYKDDEGIESFIMRLSAIVNELKLLGDPIDEHKEVHKVLHSVPRPYRDMAVPVAIELLVDAKQLSLEELCGRLLVVVERSEHEDAPPLGGRLLLTEEEWNGWRARSSASKAGVRPARRSGPRWRRRSRWRGRVRAKVKG